MARPLPSPASLFCFSSPLFAWKRLSIPPGLPTSLLHAINCPRRPSYRCSFAGGIRLAEDSAIDELLRHAEPPVNLFGPTSLLNGFPSLAPRGSLVAGADPCPEAVFLHRLGRRIDSRAASLCVRLGDLPRLEPHAFEEMEEGRKEKKRERQTDRQRGRQAGRHTDRQEGKQVGLTNNKSHDSFEAKFPHFLIEPPIRVFLRSVHACQPVPIDQPDLLIPCFPSLSAPQAGPRPFFLDMSLQTDA